MSIVGNLARKARSFITDAPADGKVRGRKDGGWVEISEGGPSADVNNIGSAGEIGFGVGVCPALPAGMRELYGTRIPEHENYGNYQYSDGSTMCWIPAYYYRWGHADNPTYPAYGVNSIHIVPASTFASVAAANAEGYALDRAFYDDGAIKDGVFYDKYQCSNNSGTASSVRDARPLSSAAANAPFSGLNGAPANIYAGAIAAAKTRGVNFFPATVFIAKAAARLSMAHAQAAKGMGVCGWYDPSGVNNFPKGCNNNALRDVSDTSVVYRSAGYSNAGLTGSGVPFNKTTHNGQACGIADLNGNMWEIALGLTQQDGQFYLLKTTARAATLTDGTTTATDAWGVLGVAANYVSIGTSYGALTGAGRAVLYGATASVFSNAVTGNDWLATCAGIPLAGGIGGSNAFGNDGLWDYRVQHMCPVLGGGWSHAAGAGVWALDCLNARAGSDGNVGFRSALYL